MLDRKVILAGYSGHGYVVVDAALKSGIRAEYYVDPLVNPDNFFGLQYLGNESNNEFNWGGNISFILGIGNNNIRKRIANLIISHNKNILNVIHPTVDFSDFFSLGYGNFLAKNVSITPLVSLGDCNILNTGCVVDHECRIGNFAHIGPGAVLAGNVKIEDYCFIGANAVIREGISIGQNSIIGAGSVVLRNVPSNAKMAGNPAKQL